MKEFDMGARAGSKSPSEHDEQVHFVAWFRRQYPGQLIFAIPNGGSRVKAEAVRLKAEGVVAGAPDLFIPGLGMFIEMKRRKGGVVSPDQHKMLAKLSGLGYDAIVCHGALEARDAVLARLG